jgi:hypothetical protein
MAAVMTRGTAAHLGADLTMSHFRGGPVHIEPEGRPGFAVVVMSGAAWALADAGRHGGRIPRARKGSALNTPWGPRASVSPSSWPGFGISDQYADPAIRAGIDAIVARVRGAL